MSCPLAEIIRERIARDGPMPVSDYMALALYHPEHGYYMTGTPVGAAGAFITAPEISQVFGELLGLWAAAHWEAIGAPHPARLVELGPGRGTLMADALRAIGQAQPALRDAATVHLVETSPVLREAQRTALAGHQATWHSDLSDVPDGTTLLFANEFFDALPIQQYVRDGAQLTERCVDVDAAGQFRFVTSAAPEGHRTIAMTAIDDADAPVVIESCPAANGWSAAIGARLASHGGAALIADYGQEAPWEGETLQAVRDHERADPLADPGSADLTAHVFFGEIRNVAQMEGAIGHPLLTQREFLTLLGIEARRDQLLATADPHQRAGIESAIDRLISPEQMGSLFKVLVLNGPDDRPRRASSDAQRKVGAPIGAAPGLPFFSRAGAARVTLP